MIDLNIAAWSLKITVAPSRSVDCGDASASTINTIIESFIAAILCYTPCSP